MNKIKHVLLGLLSASLMACGAPNALPNLPVPSALGVGLAASQTAQAVHLNFPFQQYKTAYLGFYPDDQLNFQIYTLKPLNNGLSESFTVFEEKLNPSQLPDQLHFAVPLQPGNSYFFKLVLVSKQMPCGGSVLDGQIKPTSANQRFEIESPQLEVNSDLPLDPAFADRRPISGFVRNAQGVPVVGVEVQLKNAPTGFEQTLKTDTRGYFVWGQSPLNTEVTISVLPASGASLTQAFVARRLDDTGAKRGVCDPSLNRVELSLPAVGPQN